MPACRFFKSQGIPLSLLEKSILTENELEAVRLADFEGLYQQDAADRMHISRQTFGRIIDSAHKKIADTLVTGKALCIEGGNVTRTEKPSALANGFPPSWKRHRRHGSQCENK
jgi:predicted DNA-binding protein (UPF0251 family)